MHPTDAYLQLLGKQQVTYQLFPDSPNCTGHPLILHGPHQQHAPRLERLNRQGMGIFAMVNDGDGQGRRAENVQSITAHFVDLDGTPLYDTWPLPPTTIIESSPGRYHVYWRVTNANLEDFTHTQRHLALLLAGDDKCIDLPRVLRLPGYTHHKNEPFTVTTIHADPTATYTTAQITTAFAIPKRRLPLPPGAQAYIDMHQRRRTTKNHQRPRTLDTAAEHIATAREGNRNHTLYRTACAVANQIKQGEIPFHEAEHILTIAAETAGLPPNEIQATLKSALRHAT